MELEDFCTLSDNSLMNTAKIINKTWFLLSLCCLTMSSQASTTPIKQTQTVHQANDLGQQLYDKYQWSALYYYGQTVNGALVGTAVGNFNHWPEHIQSLELAYTLDKNNFFRRFVNPLVGVTQLAANVTVRQGNDEHTIYEFNPYIIFRWANWPWNDRVVTSLALAEGVSYVTSVPALERRDNENTRRLLNYLMFEITLAAPSTPNLQFVVRIHHRSGAYGLYQADNSGSNVIGAGIRYLF